MSKSLNEVIGACFRLASLWITIAQIRWSQTLLKPSSVVIWSSMSLSEMRPNTEFFQVRIFLHSDWIRRNTKYLSVFSPNARKYGPEKTAYLDTFHAVCFPDCWTISVCLSIPRCRNCPRLNCPIWSVMPQLKWNYTSSSKSHAFMSQKLVSSLRTIQGLPRSLKF